AGLRVRVGLGAHFACARGSARGSADLMRSLTTRSVAGRRAMSWNSRILLAIVILALAGMGAATYDFIARIMGVPLFCPFAGNGCDIVQSSPYAVLFGVPLAFLGILAFAAYVILAGLARGLGSTARRILTAMLVLNVLGVGFMAYFAYVQMALIHA